MTEDLEKETLYYLRLELPHLKNQTDDFIVSFVGFYTECEELICNKGLTPSEAVKYATRC